MLLKGGHLIKMFPPGIARADLCIEGDRIVGRSSRLKARRDEDVVDCSGKAILPGLVCAHTHMYSALARGMPAPRTAPKSFPDVLAKVWWRLDQALDQESIYYSALVGALEAVRCGTTTIVDHHSSPNAIQGSLDLIRDAFRAVGVRGVLCYEVTDRGGSRRREAGLAENDRFLAANRSDPQFRGLVGAHASFTLSDATMGALGQLVRAHRSGIHIHAAEAVDDVQRTKKAHGCGIIDRLARHRLLTEQSILAHGVHLTPGEIGRVRQAGAWLVHNPRSNMNNGVGHAPVHEFGDRAALGTDGWPGDMLAESRFAHFRLRERLGPGASFPVLKLLAGGHRLASTVFSRHIGALDIGAAADLVVVGYVPPTPIDGGNIGWHVLFGLGTVMVERVMVGGRWVYLDGQVPGIDHEDVYRNARCEAAGIWMRMRG
ncbi:MAG: amidohydrolase family protein [Acidobacteriota bacterium]